MRKTALVMVIMVFLSMLNINVMASVMTVYEAEAGIRSGYAVIADSASASGGAVVKNIGGPHTDLGSVRFNVYAPSNGAYQLTVTYIQRGTKPFRVKVNADIPMDIALDSGGIGKQFSKTVDISLVTGDNTVKVYSDRELAIDLDCISVNTTQRPFVGGIEQSVAAYTGTASTRRCYGADDGYVVTGLGPNGSVSFYTNVTQAGTYSLRIWYSSAAYKGLDVFVDNALENTVFCPITGEDYNIGSIEAKLNLSQGGHTIRFTNTVASAPDIDKIQLTKINEPADGTSAAGSTEMFSNEDVRVEYNMQTGKANVYFSNVLRMENMQAVAKVEGIGSVVKSSDYLNRSLSMQEVNDGYGHGRVYTVVSRKAGLPDMIQSFYIYDNLPYILTGLDLYDTNNLSSNFMSPITAVGDHCVKLDNTNDVRTLFVPFDNDNWVRYSGDPVDGQHTSYWVSAVYDNSSRNAVVVGSVDHDTWKTGVSIYGNGDSVNFLGAFGGIWSSQYTRDYLPHGSISGQTISSPKMFLGYFDDWRTGMETYGEANSKNVSKLNWDGPVPFGYNSWYAQGSGLNYNNSAAASDFIKQLQSNGFSDEGVAYINLDSYWDNMDESQLIAFVNKCKANGQKAGIYWSHFVFWATDMSYNMGTFNGDTYRFRDAAITDGYGGVVSMAKDNNSLPLDPTSEAMQARLKYYMDKFTSLGFEYLKIDFLNYASVEGVYHNPSIQTGMQAYNYAVSQFVRCVNTNNFFLSYSIAPLFPYQYAHSRRISCDVGGSIGDTEYMMNSLTYGWWQGGTVYDFLDADMITVTDNVNAARSRYNSAIVTGGPVLLSNDYSNSGMQSITKTITSNQEINDLVRKRKPFQPVEGNTGSSACDMFTLSDAGDLYLAIFNYDSSQTKKVNVDLQRIGLDLDKTYLLDDLWANKARTFIGMLNVEVQPADSVIYKIGLGPEQYLSTVGNYRKQQYKEDFNSSDMQSKMSNQQDGWSYGGEGASDTQIYLGSLFGSDGNAARFASTTWYKTNWLRLDLARSGVEKRVALGKDSTTAGNEVNHYLSNDMCISFKAAFGSSTSDAQFNNDFKSYVSIKNQDGIPFAALLLQGYTLSLVALNADNTANISYVIADGRSLFDTWFNINFYIKPSDNTYMMTVNGVPVQTEHGVWNPASNSGKLGTAGTSNIGKVQTLEVGHEWSSWWAYVAVDDISVSTLMNSSDCISAVITSVKPVEQSCDYTVTADFSNNITSALTAKALFALYDVRGMLLGMQMSDLSLTSGAGGTITQTINAKGQVASAKVFVWKDINQMQPLAKKSTF